MRWSLRLADFEFIDEPKSGIKISHVDALSLYLGVLMEGDLPNKERFFEEQGNDPYCSTLWPGNYTSKAAYFLDDDGVVYKRRINYKHQLVMHVPLF